MTIQFGTRLRRLAGGFVVAMLAATAGCHLVDQSSFGGMPPAPAPDELEAALASDGGQPLLVILPGANVPYDAALRTALDAATARTGASHFRIESVVPQTGDLDAEQAALQSTTAAARGVLGAMAQDGVAPDRVTLSAHTGRDVREPQIRIYPG
jgi:ABC-type sugar transport system substrate-binding protein